MENGNVLEMRNITKAFPGVLALNDVSFSVRAGSVHVLAGENGAGKSTLIKIINGIYTADKGDIYLHGEKVTVHTPKHMLDLGVATIHQELSPVLDISIAENIFLGMETCFTNWKKLYADAQKLVDDLGFSYDVKKKMRTLTISDMQIIEIIKAVSKNARIIVMDEPTSSITESEVATLFQQIRKLKAKGIGIIYISHKLDEIFEIGDEISILRDGCLISTNPVSAMTKADIIAGMVGRTMSEVYPEKKSHPGDPILQLYGLSGGKFHDVSLTIRRGEVLGIAGLIGAGRTELFRSVFGLDPYTGGTMEFESHAYAPQNTAQAINTGIMMVSEDRKGEGLVLCRSVRDNISLPNLDQYSKFCFVNKRTEVSSSAQMIKALNIKTPSMETLAESLSGGNQQKIVIAKWLLHHPKLLILDEPTRGIDVGAKYEIYKIIEDLAEQGIAVVMISSEMPELIGMCDRIAVMSNGRITGEVTGDDMTQEHIMTLAVKGFERNAN